ncbi:MAG: riboflavin synthase [Woeseiaceae bacterium]|nr:riboflavin synthase [Woeseiaceae bacterium]
MFTGIIQAKGTVHRVEPRGGDLRLTVHADGIDWQRIAAGDSVAVSGICLTAVAVHDRGFETDVSRETLAVTALDGIAEGRTVNLEPALRVGDPLGGHLVSGHVDCTGRVTGLASDARSVRLNVEVPREFMHYVARKGSICIDGVSLTINDVSASSFGLNIIPHTAAATTIGDYAVGTVVNVEFDQIARYLERLIEQRDDGVSLEFLRANGYA